MVGVGVKGQGVDRIISQHDAGKDRDGQRHFINEISMDTMTKMMVQLRQDWQNGTAGPLTAGGGEMPPGYHAPHLPPLHAWSRQEHWVPRKIEITGGRGGAGRIPKNWRSAQQICELQF